MSACLGDDWLISVENQRLIDIGNNGGHGHVIFRYVLITILIRRKLSVEIDGRFYKSNLESNLFEVCIKNEIEKW